jgi:hypothetical protein
MQYYNHPDFRNQAGAAAKEQIAKRFTVANTVEKTYQVYKELYSEKQRASE